MTKTAEGPGDTGKLPDTATYKVHFMVTFG